MVVTQWSLTSNKAVTSPVNLSQDPLQDKRISLQYKIHLVFQKVEMIAVIKVSIHIAVYNLVVLKTT